MRLSTCSATSTAVLSLRRLCGLGWDNSCSHRPTQGARGYACPEARWMLKSKEETPKSNIFIIYILILMHVYSIYINQNIYCREKEMDRKHRCRLCMHRHCPHLTFYMHPLSKAYCRNVGIQAYTRLKA